MAGAAWTLVLLFAFLTVGMPFWHTCQEGLPRGTESAFPERSAAGPVVGEGVAWPQRPCLACIWNRSTSTVLLWPLALALLGLMARLLGPLAEGRRVPCCVPSCCPRAPPGS